MIDVLSAKSFRRLLRIDGVEVQAEEVTRDPRLQKIDILAVASPRVVTVVAESGEPLLNASVLVRSSGSEDAWESGGRTDGEGKATVVAAAPVIDLLVCCRDLSSTIVTSVTKDARVILRKCDQCEVTLHLDESVVSAAPYPIRVQLSWIGGLEGSQPQRADCLGSAGWFHYVRRFATDRTAKLLLREPGVYEVRLLLVTDSAAGGTKELDQIGGRATVRALENLNVSVKLAVDPDSLRRLTK